MDNIVENPITTDNVDDYPEAIKKLVAERKALESIIDSEAIKNMKKNSEELAKFITSGSEVTPLENTLYIQKYNMMICAISALNACNGILDQLIDYKIYSSNNSKKENENG